MVGVGGAGACRPVARHRVAVWRELRRAGAVLLAQGVWAVPDVPGFAAGIARIVALAARGDGEVVVLPPSGVTIGTLPGWSPRSPLRGQEWAEFVADCGKFDAEIDKEIRIAKFTMAEFEEEEHSLDRLRRWHRDLSARDVFGGLARRRRPPAAQVLRRAAGGLHRAGLPPRCTSCDGPIVPRTTLGGLSWTLILVVLLLYQRLRPGHPVAASGRAPYAAYGVVVFAALLLAGWWIARRRADLTVLAAAVWTPLGALAAVAINQPIVSAFEGRAPTRCCPTFWCWSSAEAIRRSRLIMRYWRARSLRDCAWSAADSGPWRRSRPR